MIKIIKEPTIKNQQNAFAYLCLEDLELLWTQHIYQNIKYQIDLWLLVSKVAAPIFLTPSANPHLWTICDFLFPPVHFKSIPFSDCYLRKGNFLLNPLLLAQCAEGTHSSHPLFFDKYRLGCHHRREDNQLTFQRWELQVPTSQRFYYDLCFK